MDDMADMTDMTTYYGDYVNQEYSVDTSTNVVMITGDASININLYNFNSIK